MPKNKKPVFYDKTGQLRYTMKNDCLFKIVLQNNSEVLSALIASLLHLSRDDIISVEVLNPIELGEIITAKTFILDLKVLLNRNKIINLEMQRCSYGDWKERSLGYLCRSFDNLNKGDDYINTKPAIHIGFIDFDLREVPNELYGTYQLLNVKNYAKYSDKFILSVVQLNHIELATKEDKAYGIDKWVRLFNATTWEELKMLAKSDKTMEKASKTIFRYADEDTRMFYALQAREDTMNRERALKERDRAIKEREHAMKKRERAMKKESKQLKNELRETKAALTNKDIIISDNYAQIQKLMQEIEELRRNQK